MPAQPRLDAGAAKAREAVTGATSGTVPKATTGTDLATLIGSQKTAIASALPKGLNAERFVRIVQTELRKNPKLMECTPSSFLGAVLTASQLGLEFGPVGQAFMVPFKDHGIPKVQLIIGYKGWLNLVHRGGQIASLNARAVHEADAFHYEYGLNERLTHVPAEGDRGPVTHYYCVAKTKNEGVIFEVMSKAEVEKHRDRYAKKVNGVFIGPWSTNFDEMALKTVFKRVQTWLPMATEHQSLAASVDEGIVLRGSLEDEPEVSFDIEGEVIEDGAE
jgi:recombination protein RecT